MTGGPEGTGKQWFVLTGGATNFELPAEPRTVARRRRAGNSEVPGEWPERTDTELEDAEVPDLSSDHLQVKLYPEDQSPLSEIERQSVVDSV
jgi:hypothetical protein